MKRTVSLLLIISTLLLVLVSCGEGEHEKTLKEIQEKNKAYQEFREEFFASEGYKAANAYVTSVIKEVFDNNDYDVSIEPGKITAEEFGNYDDFSSNEETKISFFENADLAITMSCADHNVDVEQMCKTFVEHKISGRFYDPATSLSYYYKLDGRNGEYEKADIPAA